MMVQELEPSTRCNVISWIHAVCFAPISFMFAQPSSFHRLYVGSLHFNLTESDIKQVFEPFGELEFVDLHRDPMTGRSKGYAFVQYVYYFCFLILIRSYKVARYKRAEDARMALEQMEGFELAGRTVGQKRFSS